MQISTFNQKFPKKPTFASILFFILFFSPAFSYNFSDIPRPIEQIVQADFARSADKGIEGLSNFFSAEYFANWKRTEISGGAQISNNTFDFGTSFMFFPEIAKFEFDKPFDIRLGAGFLQHCMWQFDYAFEADWYFNTEFQIVGRGGFLFAGQAGIGIKITDLYAIPGKKGVFFDRSLAQTILIKKKWKNGFDIYIKAGTHDFYRFPLYPHPNYILGAGKRIQSGKLRGFRFGGEAQIRMNDQFTTIPKIEGIVFRAVVNYAF